MIKAIIFDADGVLLDDTKVYIKAYQETGKRLKLKVPKKSKIRKAFGLPWDEILTMLYGNSNENVKKTYLSICNEFKPQIKIMDNSEYILKKMKIRKAVVTSNYKEALKRKMGNLIGFFEVIITKEETKKHKPNPDPLLLACKKLKIKPEEAIYVGDAVIDYQTARNAGMNFIGFISGSASKEDFKKLNVKYVTSMKDLLKNLNIKSK